MSPDKNTIAFAASLELLANRLRTGSVKMVEAEYVGIGDEDGKDQHHRILTAQFFSEFPSVLAEVDEAINRIESE